MFNSTNLSINTYKYMHIVTHLDLTLAVSVGKQTSSQSHVLFTHLNLRTL